MPGFAHGGAVQELGLDYDFELSFLTSGVFIRFYSFG